MKLVTSTQITTLKSQIKLKNRITTLKSQNRIVWIEGIDKDIIKGKALGKSCYFVRAESLNADGSSWYYIVRWQVVKWVCTCEDRGHKNCKHEQGVSDLTIAQYQAKFQAKMEAQEQEAAQKLLNSILNEDLQPHVEDDVRMATRIVGGKIVECKWNDLSESEKREAYSNLFL